MRSRYSVVWLVLSVIPGLVLVHGCATLGEIKLPREPWPVHEDGRPYARCHDLDPSGTVRDRCCATEGPGLTWEVRDGCPVAPVEPGEDFEPPADPPEEPAAPEHPPAEPPAPPAECEPSSNWARGCAEGGDSLKAAELVEAIERVRARTIHPTLISESDESFFAYTEAVAAELRAAGTCAYAGAPPGPDGSVRSPDEVGIVAGDVRVQWDVIIGSGDTRYLGHVAATCQRKGDAPRPPPAAPPAEEGSLCAGTNADARPWADHVNAAKTFDHGVPLDCATGRPHPDVLASGNYWCGDQTDKRIRRPPGDNPVGCRDGDKLYVGDPRDATYAPKPDKCYGDPEGRGFPAPHSQTGVLWHRGRDTGHIGKDVLQREPNCRPTR